MALIRGKGRVVQPEQVEGLGNHATRVGRAFDADRSTIMTSNRPIDKREKPIGDIPSATVILDRFIHHADIIQITGKSYRLKKTLLQKQND